MATKGYQSFYVGIDGKTKFAPKKIDPRTPTEIRQRLLHSSTSQAQTSPSKHYVHIRDFEFQPRNLNVSVGDTVVFHNDNQHLDSLDGHVMCIQGFASSPLLRRGERWECNIPENREVFRHVLTVKDCIFPFMAMEIRVKSYAAVPKLEKPRGGGTAQKNEHKYADAFVYAAANPCEGSTNAYPVVSFVFEQNQLSIVRRRLGLPENESVPSDAPPSCQAAATRAGAAPQVSTATALADTAPPKVARKGGWNWSGSSLDSSQGVGYRLPTVSHVDVRNSEGVTALTAASQAGHVRVMQVLLEFGADPNVPNLTAGSYDGGGDTSLHVAAKWGKSDAVRLLLTHHQHQVVSGASAAAAATATATASVRANVHGVNHLSRTPLHLASLNGHLDAVRAILEEGHPDPTLGDYNGRTPLELAVDFGRSRLEVAEAIARYASHVYACNVSTVLASADRTLVSDSLRALHRHTHVPHDVKATQQPPLTATTATTTVKAMPTTRKVEVAEELVEVVGLMEQDGQASPEQAATLKRLLLVPHSSSPPSPLACNDVASSAVVGGWGGGARDADDAVLLEAHRRYTEEAPHDVEKLVQSLLLRADTAIAEHASDAPASLSSSSSSLAAPTSAPSAPNPFRFLPALGVDALRSVLHFLVAPQVSCLAELAVTRERAGGQHGGGGSPAGFRGAQQGEAAEGADKRAEVFGPLKQFDPRTRSLPYLLRRAEEKEQQSK